MNHTLEQLIRDLYCSATQVLPENFRTWALGQLLKVIDFDAAFWGTGQVEPGSAHYIAHFDLDNQYASRLRETLAINPIRDAILNNLGQPVAMDDVFPDEAFYQSELYERLFKPYGIQRILGSGHLDRRSGLHTLLSIYRKDREHRFTAEERDIMHRMTYHLVAAASYAYFLHLELKNPQSNHSAAALCDQQGFYFEVQTTFLDLIEQQFPDHKESRLPFDISSQEQCAHNLVIKSEPMGELRYVTIRPANPLDNLTEREQEVVHWITKGLSFKEVGRQLHVAPSTVSNHLYRVYAKLGVSSRTELAKLAGEQAD